MMKKKYVAPSVEAINMLAEGMIANTTPQKNIRFDRSGQTIDSSNDVASRDLDESGTSFWKDEW